MGFSVLEAHRVLPVFVVFADPQGFERPIVPVVAAEAEVYQIP
jgi:hypothetical protein